MTETSLHTRTPHSYVLEVQTLSTVVHSPMPDWNNNYKFKMMKPAFCFIPFVLFAVSSPQHRSRRHENKMDFIDCNNCKLSVPSEFHSF